MTFALNMLFTLIAAFMLGRAVRQHINGDAPGTYGKGMIALWVFLTGMMAWELVAGVIA